MKKIAALAAALLIIVPASAMFPFFAQSSDPPGNTLFSRSYSNYTTDLGAPIVSTGNGDFHFVLLDYAVKFPESMIVVFERVGFASFANDRTFDDGETSASYEGTDVQFTMHRIPTGAMEIRLVDSNDVYFDLPSGMSALAANEAGVVVGNGKVSSTIFLAGEGTLAAVPGGILANASAGSRLLFRANPGQDSFVASSIAEGKVAGEIFATSSASNVVEDTLAFENVDIGTIVTTNDTYTATATGSLASGRVFIFNVDRAVLPGIDSGKMSVEVGDADAKASDSLASILYESGAKPRYFVAGDGDWLQVHVFVPSLEGETSITFGPAESPFGLDEIAGAMAAVVLVCVAAVALYKRE